MKFHSSEFQRGASVSAWKAGSMLKLSIGAESTRKEWIPAQFQRGISHLVKKQSVRVSAWSRAQFQRGGKFQRGNAFSMLILSISVGTENTIILIELAELSSNSINPMAKKLP